MFGWMLFGSLVMLTAFVVTGIITCFVAKQKSAAADRDDTENVVDLNDRFNRARYMEEDGN